MPPDSKPTCRVLYLEDTPEDQRLLAEAVDLAGVPLEVQPASNAESACEWLSGQTEFDVLLLDWNLPSVTAVEFLSTARKLRPTLPVVVLTGEPATVDTSAAAEFGADTVLVKPLHLDQWERLAKVLSEFCEDVQVASL